MLIVSGKKRSPNSCVFGYVLFKNIEDAEKAVEIGSLNLRGQIIKIKKFVDKEDQSKYKPKNNSNKNIGYNSPITAGNSWDSLDQNCHNQMNFNSQNFQNCFQSSNSQLFNPNFNAYYGEGQQPYYHMPVVNNHTQTQNESMVLKLNIPQRQCVPPCFEASKEKKSASRFCFDLDIPIWRNHYHSNLRFNWR